MINWFKKKGKEKTVDLNHTGSKMKKIDDFNEKESYQNLLFTLIRDIEVDKKNWKMSSFSNSITLTKESYFVTKTGSRSSNSVHIKVEFDFKNDEFIIDKITLQINESTKFLGSLKLDNDLKRIIYDVYCFIQNKNNERIAQKYKNDSEIVENLISKSTKRDDKLNKLGI